MLDPYVSISSCVLELRRRYPGYAIYALGADIAEAFLHIPVHSRHASAFGGTIPRSQVGIVSGIAVFGWTASPGYFAVAGEAVRHYQRTGASYVLGFLDQRIQRIAEATAQLKLSAIYASSLRTYSKKFRHWVKFCDEFGFPVWIDELPQHRQARIVGLFTGLCSTEGHNKHGRGNKFQTFECKMTAVAFAHRSVRNAKLNCKNPEFELIAHGYKRTNSSVARKPVTASLLLEMHRVLQDRTTPENREYNELVWASVVLAFFFLSRSSEMWEPTKRDDLETAPTHCVRAADVVLRDQRGNLLDNHRGSAASAEIIYRSHKGDQRRQGTTIRHYRSGQRLLCPVEAAETCLRVRHQWQAAGKQLGIYLSSVSSATTNRKSEVSILLKEAAKRLQLNPYDYATHSLRIGGACALLATGKSELVIRLMGRWASWCFTVYTRLRPGMLRDIAEHMIRASTWECPDFIQQDTGGIRLPSIAN
ncbi:hypothetical protein PR002_g1847 [Phytophthora rubi]|uniref:Tyr recombinase domain-containing protein n=1 Tax=Phytophthora rubi TaxID=129364 RepID=A0A6A3NNI2_9STRA|nr:hypothetical protein PR002_g1847 [Phytophthora rubi]